GHGRGVLLGGLLTGVDPLGPAPRLPRARDRRGLVAERSDRGAPTRPVHRGNPAVERGDRIAARLPAPGHRAFAPRARRLDPGTVIRRPRRRSGPRPPAGIASDAAVGPRRAS